MRMTAQPVRSGGIQPVFAYYLHSHMVRIGYRVSSHNCGCEDFAIACMRAKLRYDKNRKREDVNSRH